MERAEAVELLLRQIKRLEDLDVADVRNSTPNFTKWQRDTEVAISRVFGNDARHLAEFRSAWTGSGFWYSGMPESEILDNHRKTVESARAILASVVDEVREQPHAPSLSSRPEAPVAILDRLANRFHAVARQLRQRRQGRPTLDVRDEYDAQDLMHALLKIHFDDVRPEDAAPSRAGGSSRVDFVLAGLSTIVELKMARENLRDRQIGEELAVDIVRYKAHPECKSLFCFVYDPDGYVLNPRGLERDLTGTKDGIAVHVVVRPRG